MCGIVGVINMDRKPVNRKMVDDMVQALAHRGPDKSGCIIRGHVGLGHRRLSVIDLTDAASQPMTYQGSGIWIVYNGEVYNYLELRKILEKKGYVFKSNSDTEVILASYLEWGDDAFAKFNGMWALVIYNENNNDLILCRDRYGIKPLYYYHKGNQIVFASEHKAFWAVKKFIGTEFDPRGVTTALIDPFELEATQYSLLKHVYNLKPGSMLKVSKQSIKKQTWWRTLDHVQQLNGDTDAHIEEFRNIFEDAIKLRMRSDVPVGTSLSGGLDSSSVVAMLAKLGHQNHGAFVHSFRGTPIDETRFARIVSESTGTPIHYIEVETDDLLNHLDEVLFSFESIYAGMTDSPYRVYQAQRQQGVFVTLDGHGADEMLGGYDWYVDEAVRDIKLLSNPGRLTELYHLKNHMSTNPQVRGRFYMLRFLLRSFSFLAPIRELINRIWTKYGSSRQYFLHHEEPYQVSLTNLPDNWSNMQKRLYHDFHAMVLPRILRNFDLMSMAHGVEVRMPFLDYRLVNFVFSLPDQAKIGEGYTKNILRGAVAGVLDDRIRLRKRKVGFNSPMANWLIDRMRPWVEDVLASRQHSLDFIDLQALRTFYSGCVQSGKMSWRDALTLWKYISALRLVSLIEDRY